MPAHDLAIRCAFRRDLYRCFHRRANLHIHGWFAQ
jgi:hypothetical protein